MVVRLGIGIGLRALGRDVQPFGMAQHLLFIEAGAEVNRRVDADLPAGLQLRAQQIELQVRMHRVGPGRMIRPAVVAFGKQCDRIDVAQLQRALKLLLAEFPADFRNQAGGMEVKVDLTKTHNALLRFLGFQRAAVKGGMPRIQEYM